MQYHLTHERIGQNPLGIAVVGAVKRSAMLKKLNTWHGTTRIDEARKKLNDSVGLCRRDSIEYLPRSGESAMLGDARPRRDARRSLCKVQANNLGLAASSFELAPHDGNVVIDIWEQGRYHQ